MTSLEELQGLIASGEFHHATYRNRGTVWEGIWFYKKSKDGFRGFEVAGCVNVRDPDYEKTYQVLSGMGLHVGCYGGG